MPTAEVNTIQESGDSVFARRIAVQANGLRVAVKDVVDIAGFATRAGCRALSDAPAATQDAVVIKQIRKSGCTIIGKTQPHELAYGVTGLNLWTGTPPNVHYPDLMPGGSSSGSASAVASGDCDFAIGTDTGGSIRVPAACCGIFGLKPSFGRVSREGLSPKESSLDSVGPMAATLEDLQAGMVAMDPTFDAIPDLPVPRVAFVKTESEPAISRAVEHAARLMSDSCNSISLKLLDDAHQAGLTIIARETYQAFSYLLEKGGVSSDVASRLSRAATITDEEIQRAENIRAAITLEIDIALEQVDVLVLPTLPSFPPRIDAASDLMAAVSITSLCRPFNLSGHPALSIPLASIDGKPCSLQLVACKGNDEALFSIATNFIKKAPDLIFSRALSGMKG